MDALTLALLVAGFVLLIVGADWLVRGAANLAAAAGVSPLMIGLTVVAFGTSAPELAVSLDAAVTGSTGLAVGNVVGSNICNVLLILGTGALITPLTVERQLIRREVPIMIGASLLLIALALDRVLDFVDGLILFAGIVLYTLYAIVESRRERRAAAELSDELPPRSEPLAALAWFAVGLAMLVLGAGWLVDGAVAIARSLGVSDLVIGLTVIALGTSLPELAATAAACLRGQGGIAVGGAIGSNLFNILSVLGLTALFSPVGVPVSEGALRVDLPIMLATAIACLPIFFTGSRISRSEGALFLAYYVVYLVYVALNAADHDALGLFSSLTLFVLPLTFVTLFGLAWRARHRQ